MELPRHGRYGVAPRIDDSHAPQGGIELASHGLDLGELGHSFRLGRWDNTTSIPSHFYAVEKLPLKEEVGADGFFALDLRAGRVTAVEDFPEARSPLGR